MKTIAYILFLAAYTMTAYGFEKSATQFKSSLKQKLPEYEKKIDALFNDQRLCIDTLIVYIKQGKRKSSFDTILYKPLSIQRGTAFLKSNPHLAEIEKKFGIRKEIIVSIFRIETDLGDFRGEHNAVCAYTTLYWLAKKEKMRKSLLVQFSILLRYCFEKGFDPYKLPVSWAGAIGLPQFMPSSLGFAVDGDGDGIVDIINNSTDAIYSIANYLKKTGWNSSKEKKGIMRYNHSTSYARHVLKYARCISENSL